MRALRYAWLSTVRQPARSILGMLGVTAVGALLFDMLLLSHGLVVSFRDLLDRGGFDVRVMATDTAPFAGPQVAEADAVVAEIARLPEVEAAVPLSVRDVEIASSADQGSHRSPERADERARVQFIGADPRARPIWTLLDGRDLALDTGARRPIVVNRTLAARLHLSPGSPVSVHGDCGPEREALPSVPFEVVGVGEFPFDDATARTVGGRLSDLRALCGDTSGAGVDMVLVKANPGDGASLAAAAIRAARPGLWVVTNEELVERFSRVEFSYFRQISFVLSTLTLFFGFLLIAVLLTASVNERLGEIAALRAVGLSRGRVVAGVLWESVLMVGTGAALAVPVGLALSVWLDGILRALPGIPTSVHFFVFESRALTSYAWLLGAASVAAALYPMRIVATLPIAATLRREVVG